MTDFSVFDSPEALALNKARMDHLESIVGDVRGKTVLDVGCGVGYFSKWFADHGAVVRSLDARLSNIEELKRRYGQDGYHPRLNWIAQTLPVEDERFVSACRVCMAVASFDIVLCCGLLYHLADPIQALKNLTAVTKGMLLIETYVVPSSPHGPVLLMTREDPTNVNQGISEWSTRPSADFVVEQVKRFGFDCFEPITLPDHPEFDCVPGVGVNCRRIFIGKPRA